HVITKKGKGLRQAEENQVTYHAPGKFDAKTGNLLPKNTAAQPPKFQDVFGKTIVELASINDKIIGITPAMPTGSSLKYMMDAFPNRAFDVGIAEQHAVTLSAGLATQGMVVYCNIYSTFLQRAYDQLIHDVCLQKLPVIFCLDRAGMVGEDGATHHGIFDLAHLRAIPNLIIFAPRNEIELRNILYTVQLGIDLPIAIRYPRGRGTLTKWELPFEKIDVGNAMQLKSGQHTAIVSIGTMATNVSEAIASFEQTSSEQIAHYDIRFLKPLDEELLHAIFQKHQNIITVEDGVKKGGLGSALLEFASEHHYKNNIKVLGIPDEFPEHGTVEELQDLVGISTEKITREIARLNSQ
ncbi:MAG: transketolase C-terminal domain-containing protein, partial [Marinirhabdus sp.]|nr:transketolase C-terminal domain-containing protein [Marinirhabdus sp.]